MKSRWNSATPRSTLLAWWFGGLALTAVSYGVPWFILQVLGPQFKEGMFLIIVALLVAVGPFALVGFAIGVVILACTTPLVLLNWNVRRDDPGS